MHGQPIIKTTLQIIQNIILNTAKLAQAVNLLYSGESGH